MDSGAKRTEDGGGAQTEHDPWSVAPRLEDCGAKLHETPRPEPPSQGTRRVPVLPPPGGDRQQRLVAIDGVARHRRPRAPEHHVFVARLASLRVTAPDNQRLYNILAVLGGVIFALLVVVVFIWLSDDDDGSAVTTVTTSPTTTTTAPATTTTDPATTTTVEATTTTAAVTTTVAFEGDTSTKTNETITGSPGPNLTDVRIGDHPGFVRIVFDLTGEGQPLYIVGYEDPPFVEISGEEVDVDGNAFIYVNFSPARTHDIDTLEPTYEGDEELFPGIGPIVEVQFLGDFEAVMEWVIGLDAERPFTVDILQDPLRLVIDIAK